MNKDIEKYQIHQIILNFDIQFQSFIVFYWDAIVSMLMIQQ